MKLTKLVCTLLTASISTGALANGFYLGPSLLVQNISAVHSSYTGIHPRISGGYGGMVDNVYFAAELFSIPATATITSSTNRGAASAKATYAYGVSVLPGILISPRLIAYLRVGVVSSHFTQLNAMKTGVQAGIGLQGSLDAHWSLRGEYIYTSYQSMGRLATPRANEVGLGAIYRFDFGSDCNNCS